MGDPGQEPAEELPDEPIWPEEAAAPELELPTGDEDVPGWGCVLAVLLLIVLIAVGAGACSGLFDADADEPPATTSAEQ